MIGVVGGVVGVVLIGGTIVAVQQNQSTTRQPGGSSTVNVPGPSVSTQKASDLVTAYLRALGSGDAATALSLAAAAPSDTTLLTNSVLATSTAGKLADISVPEVTDQNATTVSASYTLGGKPVRATFAVKNVGGQFRLTQIASEVDLSSLSEVAVTVAGLRPGADVVQLFPGVYPVKPVNKFYALSTSSVRVADLGDVTAPSAKLSLSSSGKSALISATKKKYSWCLKQNSVKPSGCGFAVRIPTGVKLRTSTISWTTRSGAKWAAMKPKLISANLIEAKAPAKVHFYARDARVSSRYWYKDVSIVGVQALISGSKITVTLY
ncbi:hypothetical protein [Micropruina sp.]|uniref:hypothetical protein n=1 Tax=Micropruina sp. TaxID=2737536 RepID=UPI0039E30322